MPKIQIRHSYEHRILFEGEYETIRDAVLAAHLSGADLSGAILSGAILRWVDFSGVDFIGAILEAIKADLWLVLTLAPNEVGGLLEKLRAGEIDGSLYDGDCCCLIGTLANVRGCGYTAIPGLVPRSARPAERWFLEIRPGHTPDNSQIAKITEGWIVEWLALQQSVETTGAR